MSVKDADHALLFKFNIPYTDFRCSWDALYETEIANHTVDSSDIGTIWFDDCAAEDKAVAFLRHPKLGLSRQHTSFLDLGTGNGHFLFRLRDGESDNNDDDKDEMESDNSNDEVANEGFEGRMMGVDYSLKSIEFARRIAQEKGYGEDHKGHVEFKVWDLMTASPEGLVLDGRGQKGWDVVLDKGTFDAISLSEEKDDQERRICEGYKEKVVPLIKDGGILFITSCNWTEEELKSWFQGGQLRFEDALAYKSFSFGGRKGQSVSSVCFRKTKCVM